MKFVVGLDEVGRGSLAGPVVVAAVCLPKNLAIKNSKLGTLRDSKKLSPQKREAWFSFLKNYPKVSFSIARVYPSKIDQINITNAANLAAYRAYLRLAKQSKLKPKNTQVFLDGGLYLKAGKKSIPGKTTIKGDEKIPAIMMASIVAKVVRDKQMRVLSKTHPDYGLEIHKGYGTRVHLAALKKNGPSLIHRLTFLKNKVNIT